MKIISSPTFSLSTLDLRRQLLVLIILIFIPVLAILLFTGYRQYRHRMRELETDTAHAVRLFVNEQARITKQTSQLLKVLSHVPSVEGVDIDKCNRFLQAIHRENPEYSTIVVADKSGIINCCAIPIKKPINVADRSWFRRVRKSRAFTIDHFLISRSAKKASLPFAYPVLSPDGGEFIAAVGAAFDLSNYTAVFQSMSLPENSVMMMTDNSGKILYHSFTRTKCLGRDLKTCRGFDLPDTSKGRFSVRDIDGKDRIYWFERFSVGQAENQVTLLIGISKQAIFSDIKRSLAGSLVLLGVVALLSFAIARYFGGRFILTPINRLVQRTRMVRQGDLSVPEPENGLSAELLALRRAFDEMVVDLALKGKARDEAYEIINNSPLVAVMWDYGRGWRVDFVTENVQRMFGYLPDDLIKGRIPYDRIIHPDDLEGVRQELEACKGDAGCHSFAQKPYRIFTRSGQVRWLDGRITVNRDENGDISRYHGIFLDITERRHSEEEVQRLRNYLTNIIDSMPSIIIGVDRQRRVTLWNRQAESVLEIPSAMGMPLEKVFPTLPVKAERVEGAMRTGRVYCKPRLPRKEGSLTVYDSITVYPLVPDDTAGAVIRIDDVTEQVNMEEMMIQSEKMMTVGGLAAGMAHEINNPLAGVIQNVSLLENRLEKETMPANISAAIASGTTMGQITAFMDARKVPDILRSIRTSGLRMAEIVENMLNFARKGDASFSGVDGAELMASALELAGTDYDLKKQYDFKSITVHREFEENLPLVVCERGKIQQVLLNLLHNGAHAMFEKKEPGYAPRFILRLFHNRDLDMLQIEVEDNGTGLDRAMQKKIFEPFFTTKPVGRGTGLGLSVSYFIITENHGGSLTVESEPGKGANFIIRLPLNRRPV